MSLARIPERQRLHEDARREFNWKRWGPYLSERQWGTVREDYSADGSCWDYFSHDHARSRAYRWGEDGLLGITDRQCRLCFSIALWNGKDPILKERLFGLTGNQGNHGEDVKEEYFYLDSTPTHSWLRGLYKYPQARFPYEQLVDEAKRRSFGDPEFELVDTGVFAEQRYFDVNVDYAKAGPDDILIRITVHNRGDEDAPLHLLPQLWFRNTWSWGREGEGYWPRGEIRAAGERTLHAESEGLGNFTLDIDAVDGKFHGALFTENESNHRVLWNETNGPQYAKDAFHEHVVNGETSATNPLLRGTKAAFHCEVMVKAHSSHEIRLRLRNDGSSTQPFGADFSRTIAMREREADAFYAQVLSPRLSVQERQVQRQAYAGLCWSKQYYYFDVGVWLEGDPSQPPPPPQRREGRNQDWTNLYNRDVVSMPDKWEYPWYAAWDLAFHMLPFARIDPQFAKDQLILLLREWYMAPNGQLPAYEFNFSDVNPPVHAWACWRVYKMTGPRGKRDRVFLARTFHKLLLNFTWWVNRKDLHGKHVFGGGFLGLDNIGVFDRSKPMPDGGYLEQADGTAWMAFYCSTMLCIALELAQEDPSYEDVASKFFEHFVAITHAMNTLGGTGLWDPQDGFYYDQVHLRGETNRLRIRSMVGLIPMFAVGILDAEQLENVQGFHKRMQWFLENESDLALHVTSHSRKSEDPAQVQDVLLSIPSKEQLLLLLRYLLDENEFLSPFGVRSVSAVHRDQPFVFSVDGVEHRVDYTPGESRTSLFGGNSNWRGPVWLPVNFLLIESLERYGHFYGDELKVECPTGSGSYLTLSKVAEELAARVARPFAADAEGQRPFAGGDRRFADDDGWRDLVLFHEYFHGDTGRGCGASHQTGWTALVAQCLERVSRQRVAGDLQSGAASRGVDELVAQTLRGR
ncbi:glucosidase [Planctomycetota bacterium]|nr:glucosidase [Planctomycetota bacterium]